MFGKRSQTAHEFALNVTTANKPTFAKTGTEETPKAWPPFKPYYPAYRIGGATCSH